MAKPKKEMNEKEGGGITGEHWQSIANSNR